MYQPSWSEPGKLQLAVQCLGWENWLGTDSGLPMELLHWVIQLHGTMCLRLDSGLAETRPGGAYRAS